MSKPELRIVIREAYQCHMPYGFEAVLFDATGERIARIWERYSVFLLVREAARRWPGVEATLSPAAAEVADVVPS
jgi:hypothetical protein